MKTENTNSATVVTHRTLAMIEGFACYFGSVAGYATENGESIDLMEANNEREAELRMGY